jgi:hypothetical protein
MMAEEFLPAPKAEPPPRRSDTVAWRGRGEVPLVEAVAELNRLQPVLLPPPRRLTRLQDVQSGKLAVLGAAGMDPYPSPCRAPRAGFSAVASARAGQSSDQVDHRGKDDRAEQVASSLLPHRGGAGGRRLQIGVRDPARSCRS